MKRQPPRELFFREDFTTPLDIEGSGYAFPLEMVRLAPSASNKQPWRVIGKDGATHFYLKRTPGYRERNKKMFGIADLQRVDMGIAMCHFHLAAKEAGLAGGWRFEDPGFEPPWPETEFTATWVGMQ